MLTLTTRAELLLQGYDDDEIRRRVKAGTLQRLFRGVYSSADPDAGAPGTEEQHLLHARAAARVGDPSLVFSHVTAAVAHDLPVPRASLAHVHMIKPDGTGGSHVEGVRLTRTSLLPHEVTDVNGLAVTSVARTLADLGRTVAPGWALAAHDQAFRQLLGTPAGVQETLVRMRGIPGVRNARRVLESSDPRAESPAESLSRMVFIEAGLAPDALQKEFHHAEGTDRVDFWWADGVVGEFDGQAKYHANAHTGQTPGKIVWLEKRREDRLRRLGLIVVRWVWDDLIRRPEVVISWLQQALHEARKRNQYVGAS